MNKTLTAPNCLIYIIQQTCFKPHYFNSLIQFYCIHKQVRPHFSGLPNVTTDMELKIDNKDYKLIIANDVFRDGIGLEIWDTETDKMIIEIFRADSDQRIDFFTEKVTVPIELIEKSLEIFNKRIGKEFQK